MGVFSWWFIDNQLTINWPLVEFCKWGSGQLICMWVAISWPLLNAPLFSVQLTIVEYSFIFHAVDHCWTLLYFLCGWLLLNAPIFSVQLTTVERSYILCAVFFVCILKWSYWKLLSLLEIKMVTVIEAFKQVSFIKLKKLRTLKDANIKDEISMWRLM